MADYDIMQVFKGLSEESLKGIFSEYKIDPSIDEDKLKENISDVVQFWNSKLGSNDNKVSRLHDFFQDLNDFANKKCNVTRLAMELAAGGDEPFELPDDFESKTRYEQGTFLRLHNNDLWVVLTQIAFAEEASNSRSWTEYNDLPQEVPDISIENIKLLEETLIEYFSDEKQSKQCSILSYIRQSQYYFFATLDDKPKYYEVQNEDETGFEPIPLVLPFRVIFVYDEENGEFSIFSELPKKEHNPLATKIVKVLVDHDDELQPIGKPTFDLIQLASRQFEFPTDPADGIATVTLKSITVAPTDSPETEITFKHKTRNIHDCIDDFANRTRINENSIEVKRATISIKMNSAFTKFKSITFDIGLHSCTLKSKKEAQRLLGEKYVREWGFRNV